MKTIPDSEADPSQDSAAECEFQSAETLDAVACERIATQLRAALDMVDAGLESRVDEFRETLADAFAQADAWALVHTLDQQTDATRTASQLRCARLSTRRNEPATEFLLIPFGEVSVERPLTGGSFVFTRKHAKSAYQWFISMGRKLAIDYEHQSFDRLNTRPDGLRPAAGWIGGLETRDDGLWAVDVTWTDRAQTLLRSGEYRYFSPVIFWTDGDYSDVAALGPVALTNDPAMHGVHSLAATRELAADKADGEVEASVDGQATESGTRQQLEAAEAEVVLLKKQLVLQEADAFIERGMRVGKILDSTSIDWREDYLRDPDQANERLSRAPVLLPPGRVLTLDRHGSVATLSDSERQYRQNAGVFQRMGIEAEDLAAYERAAAAGRVRGVNLTN